MVRGEKLATVVAKRHEFLRALRSEPMGKAELVRATEASRSTVDRAVAELEERGLAVREEGRYRATFTGACVLSSFDAYRTRLDDIGRAHEVTAALPPDADLDPAALEGATVAPSEPHAFGYPPREALGLVADAARMRGVVSVVTPQYVDALHEGVGERGLALELVLTPPVWDTVTAVHREEFADLFRADSVALYRVDRRADYALWTVEGDGGTTSCVVVYTDAGVEGVVTNDTDAMNEWAAEAFDRFRSDATPVEEFPPLAE